MRNIEHTHTLLNILQESHLEQKTSLMDILQRFRSLNLAVNSIALGLDSQIVAHLSRNLLRNLRQMENKQ